MRETYHILWCLPSLLEWPQRATRTRLTNPKTHPEFETTRGARSDTLFLSRRAQPPLGTGEVSRARVVALHKCATRRATAAIDSVGPVPPTKIAKCIVMPRRAHSFPGHSHNNSARQGRVHKQNAFVAV